VVIGKAMPFKSQRLNAFEEREEIRTLDSNLGKVVLAP
jgi:hypothetical protein